MAVPANLIVSVFYCLLYLLHLPEKSRSDSIDHFFGDDMMDVSDGLFSPSDHLISGITEFVPVPVSLYWFSLR